MPSKQLYIWVWPLRRSSGMAIWIWLSSAKGASWSHGNGRGGPKTVYWVLREKTAKNRTPENIQHFNDGQKRRNPQMRLKRSSWNSRRKSKGVGGFREKRVIHRVKCCSKDNKERTKKYRMGLSTGRLLVTLERKFAVEWWGWQPENQ